MKSNRIIIIDDNVNIHNDFIKILSHNKPDKQSLLEKNLFGEAKEGNTSLPEFEIDTALQGIEGIEKIAKAHAEGNPYSIAFVDVRMPPGLDGIETIKQIYPIDPNIQVVICSAFSDYTWEQTAENLGLRDNLLILKKPFDSIAVRQLVCSLVKKTALLSQLRENTQSLEYTLKNNHLKLEKTLSLNEATLNSTTDGILIIDDKGSIINFNAHFCELWNVPKSLLKLNEKNAILDHLFNQIYQPEVLKDAFQKITLKTENATSSILTFKNNRVIEQFSIPHLYENAITCTIFIFRDITTQYSLAEKLAYQSTHDALTDLPNRLMVHDVLKNTIDQANRFGAKVGVFFINLDKFKIVNESLSHDAGDELLKIISQQISPILREEDTLARVGGDEFLVITPSIFKHEHLENMASTFLNLIKQPFTLSNRTLNITASIGIAVYPEDGVTSEDLLRNADLAMGRAKNLGKDQFQFYDKKFKEEAKIQLEREFEQKPPSKDQPLA